MKEDDLELKLFAAILCTLDATSYFMMMHWNMWSPIVWVISFLYPTISAYILLAYYYKRKPEPRD